VAVQTGWATRTRVAMDVTPLFFAQALIEDHRLLWNFAPPPEPSASTPFADGVPVRTCAVDQLVHEIVIALRRTRERGPALLHGGVIAFGRHWAKSLRQMQVADPGRPIRQWRCRVRLVGDEPVTRRRGRSPDSTQ